MNVKLIYNHIDHHASLSGYDQLAKYVDGKPFTSGGLCGKAAAKVPWKWLEKIPAYHTDWYGGPALRRELEICGRMLLPRKTLYHFFYAENDLRVSSKTWLRWNNRIVGTFHQPPEFLDGHLKNKQFLTHIDGIVVMSESQIPYLEKFIQRERIYHVPHGVNVDYWCPDPETPRFERPTFLVVGQWLRDIELVKAAIQKLNDEGAEIDFKIVTFPEHAAQYDHLKNVEVLSGIPDEKLLEINRRAHGLFLPLTMCTANNAVLEAMSCGTPIISTDHGGVPEYVGDECAFLIRRGEVEGAVAAIKKLADNPQLVAGMGKAARDRAAKVYAWEVIGERQNQAYRQILGLRKR